MSQSFSMLSNPSSNFLVVNKIPFVNPDCTGFACMAELQPILVINHCGLDLVCIEIEDGVTSFELADQT